MNKILIYGLLILLTSCSLFGGGKKSNTQGTGMEQKKKKKPKKCKIPSCHVRMTHMHEGAEYKGKTKWYLKPFFFFNREPKIGEGYKPEKRDPHQKKGRN